MNWKKQRYNSSQKPLCRLILFFDAIWATAVEVAILRGDAAAGPDGRSPSIDALFFLAECLVERLVQSAMMADASEENLHVVRFFDNPGGKGYDLTYIARELHKYLNTIDYLFVGEDAGCLKCGGYTTYIIEEILKRPRVAVIKQKTYSVGGPGTVGAAMLSRCLARMASWVRLAALCVDVEFPGWKCMMAFTVFDGTCDGRKSTGFPADFAQDCWQRLGATFEVDPKQLEEEANAMVPHARHEFAMANAGSSMGSSDQERILSASSYTWAEAWASATQTVLERAPNRVQSLLPVVSRLQAWDGISSSVVEQGFSRTHEVFSHWGSWTNDSTTWSTAKIVLDIQVESPEWHEILHRAQKIFLETWGPARVPGARHWIGQRSKPSGKNTETEWRRA